MPSPYYNFDHPALYIFKVESVLLPDASQTFYLVDSLYHKISLDPNIQMKNGSGTGFSIYTCLVKPAFSGPAANNNNPSTRFGTRPRYYILQEKPGAFTCFLQFTPSLEQIFHHVLRLIPNFTRILLPKPVNPSFVVLASG